MRYTNRQYATALLDALTSTSKPKETALRFMSVLRRQRALGRLSAIFETARDIDRETRGGHSVTIVAATEAAAQEATRHFHAHDDVTTHVDPHVGGGVSVTVDGVRFDATLQRKFEDLHKALTH